MVWLLWLPPHRAGLRSSEGPEVPGAHSRYWGRVGRRQCTVASSCRGGSSVYLGNHSYWQFIALIQERKSRGENDTQEFLADIFAYQVRLIVVWLITNCSLVQGKFNEAGQLYKKCGKAEKVSLTCLKGIKKQCTDRESNPGLPRGRREFYHWTISACCWSQV